MKSNCLDNKIRFISILIEKKLCELFLVFISVLGIINRYFIKQKFNFQILLNAQFDFYIYKICNNIFCFN